MPEIASIATADVRGKTALVRADLNVPMKDGVVTDDTRILRFAGTVHDLVKRGAKVVIMSHLGRPKGIEASQTLRSVSFRLSSALGMPVSFIEDCVGDVAEMRVRALPFPSVAVLENLRFHAAEEKNDRLFAMRLAITADLYVNDAFSCAHRAHASTHAITEFLPSYAGPSLLEEVRALESVLESPRRPVGALIGGAKVSTKISILETLLPKVNTLIIVGGMANTFLHAKGHDVANSLCEKDQADTARRVMAEATRQGCRIILPHDGIAADEYKSGAKNRTVPVEAIPSGTMILDAGPASVHAVNAAIDELATLLWNGPAGAFELEPFNTATNAIARHVAARTLKGELVSVAGGGDTAAALNGAGVSKDFTYLSTAGGAFLEWLEGKDLPGISILKTRNPLGKAA